MVAAAALLHERPPLWGYGGARNWLKECSNDVVPIQYPVSPCYGVEPDQIPLVSPALNHRGGLNSHQENLCHVSVIFLGLSSKVGAVLYEVSAQLAPVSEGHFD